MTCKSHTGCTKLGTFHAHDMQIRAGHLENGPEIAGVHVGRTRFQGIYHLRRISGVLVHEGGRAQSPVFAGGDAETTPK